MTPDDPKVLFLHLPKTGGLTLREIIVGHYRRREVLIPRAPESQDRTSSRRYIEYLNGEAPLTPGRPRNIRYLEVLGSLSREEVRQLRVVMGHFWFGIHVALPAPAEYLTVIRDPVDRVLSMYHHRATRHGLRLSVEEYIRSERDLYMNNDQVRRLANTDSGDARVRPCTEETYARALRHLDEHFAVVGTTDRYDELIVALRAKYGWARRGYARQNVSGRRPRREDLSSQALTILRRHNQYDLELHAEASRRLDDLIERLNIDMEREVGRLRRQVWISERTQPAVDWIRERAARAAGRRPPARARRRQRRRSRARVR